MAGGIFISYRRDDAKHAAGRLVDRLVTAVGRDKLFMDVDNIEPGLDFVKVLNDQVARCDCLLALIGPQWLEARNAKGQRRLDDPGDFVRIEIEAALARDIRVVPVLLDGAEMPPPESLPSSLQSLPRRQAVRISHERFAAEADDLAGKLQRAYAPRPAPVPPNVSRFAALMSRGVAGKARAQPGPQPGPLTAAAPAAQPAQISPQPSPARVSAISSANSTAAPSTGAASSPGLWHTLKSNRLVVGFVAGAIATSTIEQLSGLLLIATFFSGFSFPTIYGLDDILGLPAVIPILIFAGFLGAVYARYLGGIARSIRSDVLRGIAFGMIASAIVGDGIVFPLLMGTPFFSAGITSSLVFNLIQGAVFGSALALIYRWLGRDLRSEAPQIAQQALDESFGGRAQSDASGKAPLIAAWIFALGAVPASVCLALLVNPDDYLVRATGAVFARATVAAALVIGVVTLLVLLVRRSTASAAEASLWWFGFASAFGFALGPILFYNRWNVFDFGGADGPLVSGWVLGVTFALLSTFAFHRWWTKRQRNRA